MENRRIFMLQCSLASVFLADSALGDTAMLAETDAQAVALGYKADATRVDKQKYPNYAAGQHCGVCAIYQGKPADKSGVCPLYAGKQVAGAGWCSAWSKKA